MADDTSNASSIRGEAGNLMALSAPTRRGMVAVALGVTFAGVIGGTGAAVNGGFRQAYRMERAAWTDWSSDLDDPLAMHRHEVAIADLMLHPVSTLDELLMKMRSMREDNVLEDMRSAEVGGNAFDILIADVVRLRRSAA